MLLDTLRGKPRYSQLSNPASDSHNEPERDASQLDQGGAGAVKRYLLGFIFGLGLFLCGVALGVFVVFLQKGDAKVSQIPTQLDSTSDTIHRLRLERSTQQVHQDAAFQAPPPASGGAEPVWDSLIPNGLGYVINPDVSPDLSVIGVFHQLHCLYMIRRAYYAIANETILSDHEHGKRDDFDLGIDRHPHVGHCFDYLRQSLQCCADSSLEPNKEKVVGNPDWGFKRQCRNFPGLKSWAEEWAAVDLPGGFIPDILAGDGHAS